jgi:hypothetical protein
MIYPPRPESGEGVLKTGTPGTPAQYSLPLYYYPLGPVLPPYRSTNTGSGSR